MAYDTDMSGHPRSQALLLTLVLATGVACGNAGPSLAERAATAKAAQEAADAKARDEARAKRDAQRLTALWRYQQATVGGGAQTTAAAFAADDVDTDGTGPRPVQIVFRDHEKWGRSAYLVLSAGDFACAPRCSVAVAADGAAPETLAAFRPDTDEAIALFVRDWERLWRLTGGATKVQIGFPVKAGGTRTATFEVSGLDESKMPGW